MNGFEMRKQAARREELRDSWLRAENGWMDVQIMELAVG
jgi:hypothetical protein